MQLHDEAGRLDADALHDRLVEFVSRRVDDDTVATIESLRATASAYRNGEVASRKELYDLLDGLDRGGKSTVARAFTAYFELANLAEERERVRAIRERTQAGTLAEGLGNVGDVLAGADPETANRVLEDVLIQPTFTAHPTEARRKTVKTKLHRIAGHLETLEERRLTDHERERVSRTLGADIATLWETSRLRERRPDPADEARNVQWYLEHTLFDVIGDLYDDLETTLEDRTSGDLDVPTLYEFRSWAGSDRDGNPFVTPATTEQTLERQREVVLDRYREALDQLSGVLSHDEARLTIGEALRRSLATDRDRLPRVVEAARERYPNEPYRRKIRIMTERIDRVGDIRPGGYDGPDAFLDDVAMIAESLRANDGEAVAGAHVDPLIRRVETFGFSLAHLDLRDHRARHTEAVGELLEAEGLAYTDRSEAERQAVLTDGMLQADPVVDLGETAHLSETAAEVSRLFTALADWQREFGARAIDTYCISMTEAPSHVLEVLFLADQAGVVDLPEHSGLDVVPLLETESALANAEELLETLYGNEAYATQLDARNNTQEVMLGYSDSNKENGFLAANWDLYRTQRNIADVCDRHDITVRLFHGRGGSISRGGGPMNEALLALPSDTVRGPVKFTEQGEAIAEKYANPRIASRELEQMLDAQVRARLRAIRDPEPDIPPDWPAAVAEMAETARSAYRDLLATDGFVAYLEAATPITVIEDLNLGSRPASRSGERTVEDLRAIPWVFSWTQSRCILPGWYGLGTALASFRTDDDVDDLREMYREWPFFRTTLDNAALSLAKTEMEIAGEYAALAPDEIQETIFEAIVEEYDRTVEQVLAILDRDRLVDRPWLQESLEKRNPHVDPLNLLQCRLLGQAHRTEAEERTLRLTVKGIAQGMKNTG